MRAGMDEPLLGRRVLVTRAAHQSGELSTKLRQRGAEVIELPLIDIVPVAGAELEELDRALKGLVSGAYEAVLFGSSNAVQIALARMNGGRPPSRTRVFAIGRATAQALAKAGIAAEIADEAVSEGLLAKVLGRLDVRGTRLLYPRAREGRDVAIEGLRAAGAAVEVVVAYETRTVEEGGALPAALDWITFASPSAVRAFAGRFGTKVNARIACIGPISAEAAAECGFSVAVTAEEYSADGLVTALVRAG
jgi:uroporphyrinogen III methyltransferase / synthase